MNEESTGTEHEWEIIKALWRISQGQRAAGNSRGMKEPSDRGSKLMASTWELPRNAVRQQRILGIRASSAPESQNILATPKKHDKNPMINQHAGVGEHVLSHLFYFPDSMPMAAVHEWRPPHEVQRFKQGDPFGILQLQKNRST